MKHHARQFTRLCCLLVVLSFLSISPALATERPVRVLILPLTIHAEKDLTFLNQGIMDMMVSRISQSATVIRHTTVEPEKDPVQLGRDLGANYVVSGSLTVFGSSASTVATLKVVNSGDTALQFSQFDPNSGDVLMHIDQFATQVYQYLVSLPDEAALETAPTAEAPAVMILQVAPPVQPVQPLQPAAVAAPQAPAVPEPAVPPAPVVAAVTAAVPKTAEPAEALWTSNPFKGIISALATGDVNGDGRPDIVYVHEKQIVVETRDGDRLNRLTAFDAGKRHTTIAVDTGDINGNGTAEIFVTRLNEYSKLDSVALEWNGTALKPIAGHQKWYFRVSNDPEKGPMLMGQRRGSPSANDTGELYTYTHFLPGVFELSWTGKDYQAGRRFALPDGVSIYRFARGDIFNDGKIRTIAYSVGDKLRIYDPTGSPQWAGQETLGGNPLFLKATSATDVRDKDHSYLTQRFFIVDLDGDGNVDVVTVHNRDAARGFVERFRKYTRGRVIALRWNKVNMQEIWTGEEISGYISDFSVTDLDGDGRLEAVYAMVASTGLAQTKSSNIVVSQIDALPGT